MVVVHSVQVLVLPIKALYCVINFFFSFLKCREVYHTKRMQHVICIKWSADSKYILSGSDEMNIRLWKANAAEKLGAVSPALFSVSFLLENCDFGFSGFHLAAYWLLLGMQEVVVCVPINSYIFLSCQTYCILYFTVFLPDLVL